MYGSIEIPLKSSLSLKKKRPKIRESLEEKYKEEFKIVDRPASEISYNWKVFTLVSYFVVLFSGIATTICIGDLVAAFENNCILYAKLEIRELSFKNETYEKALNYDDVNVIQWGNKYDCNFCQFSPLSSAVFAGILFAMFLQCGRGGYNELSGTQSWGIVLPALVINLVFFIISTVSLAKTVGGLSSFCTYTIRRSLYDNISSCYDVFSFRYPWDSYNSDLYLDYVISQIGVSVHLVGWFFALIIIVFRCMFGVDFIIHSRRIPVSSKKQVSFKEECQVEHYTEESISNGPSTSRNSLKDLLPKVDSTSSSSEESSSTSSDLDFGDEETSFISAENRRAHRKKTL